MDGIATARFNVSLLLWALQLYLNLFRFLRCSQALPRYSSTLTLSPLEEVVSVICLFWHPVQESFIRVSLCTQSKLHGVPRPSTPQILYNRLHLKNLIDKVHIYLFKCMTVVHTIKKFNENLHEWKQFRMRCYLVSIKGLHLLLINTFFRVSVYGIIQMRWGLVRRSHYKRQILKRHNPIEFTLVY